MSTLITILCVAAAGCWLAAAAIGAGLAHRRIGLVAASGVSALGGVCAVAGGAELALHRSAAALHLGSGLVGAASFQPHPLAGAFIVLLGLIAVAIGLYAPRYHEPSIGTAVYLLAYNLALIASLAVLAADNVVTFLVAWESMALLCYLLILRHHARQGVPRNAFLFLALGETGFLMIVAAFVILAAHTGTLNLELIAHRAGSVPAGWRTAAFLLALAGFGFKAGIVPLHIWLPAAHPVAPADGSAFLSGLIVKLGIYGIALFGFELLRGGPGWWGIVVMIAGAVSALLGILYALMERDIKRFLAFSTIENVGVILVALGGAMVFTAYGQRAIGALLLVTMLYMVVNHGAYKTLLFLEAGVIEHATGTRDMDQLGGLVKTLPRSAVIALIGMMGIAALPPLNGFVSEWMVFQGLFQGFRIGSHLVGILIVIVGAVIALTAGLAINAFVRAFGIPFLGMPRTTRAARAREAGLPICGPGLLAASCVFLALGAPLVLMALQHVSRAVTAVNIRPVLIAGKLTVLPGHANFSSLSPTYLAAFLIVMLLVPIVIYRVGRTRAPSRRTPVWDGGILNFKARMQYTATTHANPIRVTFDALYRPHVNLERASDDPAGRSGPVHYRFTVTPIFERYLYRPIVRAVERIAQLSRPLQAGDVNLYLLYVFVAVVIALAVYTY